jgi:2-polyprenyl-3-methyl-5-hydroxy-6-metoxy-1,4-benzoquinol methylase
MHQEQWNELAKYGQQLDFNLKRLNETKDEIVRVQAILQSIIQLQNNDLRVAVNRLADRFTLMEQQLANHGLPKIDYYDHEFTSIRKLAESPDWPLAVEEMVRDENYEKAKAANILDMIVIENVAGKRVLDFGCGEGYLTSAIATRGAALAVGYDPAGKDERFQNKLLTKDKLVAANNAPYDFIVVYDVLDHCEDPVAALKFIEDLASMQTKVIVRNHPFSSRHGKHLFTTLNRAFLHMVLDDIELVRLCGSAGMPTRPILRPVAEYRGWLANTKFNIELETPVTTPVEPFFLNPDNYLVRDKLVGKYQGEDPTRYMQIDFMDYVLKKRTQVVI